MEILEKLSNLIQSAIDALGVYGPLLGCLLIVAESILPILPLFVFITLNFLAFGNILGFIISWACTVIGCMLSFFIFRKGVKGVFTKRLRNHPAVDKLMTKMERLKTEQIVAIVAVPFTPAFAVNIAAGLSNMRTRKFLIIILIGKIFMVYFWGFIGTSLIQSIKDPVIIVKVIVATILAYAVSAIVSKRLKLD